MLSSPANRFDAVEGGPLADALVAFAIASGYQGGPIGKGIFDAVDQYRNDPRFERGPRGIVEMIMNTLREVNNDSAPRKDMSDLELLYKFNLRQQAAQYRTFTNPTSMPRTQLVYIMTDSDNIVKTRQAIKTIQATAGPLDVDLTVLNSHAPRHAATEPAAQTYAAWDNIRAA